jgi:hypothetical protein
MTLTNKSYALDPEDDLLAYERSTFRTFIDESQANLLIQMWDRQERWDNENFLREFCYGEDD